MSTAGAGTHALVQVKLYWDGEARGPLTTSALAASDAVRGSYLLPRSLSVDLVLRIFSVDKLPIERVDVQSSRIVEGVARAAKLDELGIDEGGCLMLVWLAPQTGEEMVRCLEFERYSSLDAMQELVAAMKGRPLDGDAWLAVKYAQRHYRAV